MLARLWLMNRRTVLVVGSGGREHALAWALAGSPTVGKVVVAPGSVGMRHPGEEGADPRAPIEIAEASVDDPQSVASVAVSVGADLAVVGPEVALCVGVADALTARGVLTFGPMKASAQLEGSKVFLKRFAERHGIPSAAFDVVTTVEEAERALAKRSPPYVVKADGLCAGKGVTIADTLEEARAAAVSALVDGTLGEAGRTLVIEDAIPGRELSIHVVTDGERSMMFPSARDHKRLLDGSKGPNTGGMGVIAPTVDATPGLLDVIQQQIIVPTLKGLRKDNLPFRGVLFAGIMVTPAGEPLLLEYNVRFGDPETEALVRLYHGDWAELFASTARGELNGAAITRDAGANATVVILAAGGYPASPQKGDAISGLAEAATVPGALIFHAGTRHVGEDYVTAGGRVLAVSAVGASLVEAQQRAYLAAGKIRFSGKQFRGDIGTD